MNKGKTDYTFKQADQINVLLSTPVDEDSFMITPSIGLAYLSTAARKVGCNVAFLDCLLK